MRLWRTTRRSSADGSLLQRLEVESLAEASGLSSGNVEFCAGGVVKNELQAIGANASNRCDMREVYEG